MKLGVGKAPLTVISGTEVVHYNEFHNKLDTREFEKADTAVLMIRTRIKLLLLMIRTTHGLSTNSSNTADIWNKLNQSVPKKLKKQSIKLEKATGSNDIAV